MTVGRKFALTGAFLMSMTLVVGAVSLLGLASADRYLASVADDSLAGVSQCSRVEAGLLEMYGEMWRYLSSTDASDTARMEQQIQRRKDQMKTDMAAVQKAIYTDDERELNRRIVPPLDQFYRAWDGIIDLSRTRNEEARKKFIAEATPAYQSAREAMAAETEYDRSTGTRYSAEGHSQGARMRAWIGVALVVSVFGGAGLLLALVRNVNRTLIHVVSDLSSGASQVASAATQIASSSRSLAQGSSEQAASLEETSASSEEINSMARKNTENTRSAAEMAGRLQAEFVEANRFLDETVAAMQELNGSSEKISKIIKVIDEIAFQTNILALNAAVEAARAGEAGMGFAVVADEVRNLAQRSAQAAKDTASLIEDSIARSRDGKAKVDHVAAAIRGIAQDSTKIQILMDEVNVASQEQSRGIEQVARAVIQMEQVTQRAAASAQESASASNELTGQASDLQRIVEQLTEMVGGNAPTGTISSLALPAVDRHTSPANLPMRESRKQFPLRDGESDF